VTSESEDYDNTIGHYTGYMENPDLTTDFAGEHRHILEISTDGQHSHRVEGEFTDLDGGHNHPFSYSDQIGDHVHIIRNHRHQQTLIPHTHNISIPSHSHNLSLPNHTHDLSLPNHTHGIEYGIFEGPTPTAITVKVDGNIVPGLGTSANDVDIVPYLAKEEDGRIQRGAWHTIEIAPNILGRIVASVVTQIFVQSRGGGDY